MKKIDARITVIRHIGEPEDERNEVEIRIEDHTSGVRFCTVTMDVHRFAQAILTPQASVPAIAELCGLENVGKTLHVEERPVWIPREPYGETTEAEMACIDASIHSDETFRLSDAKNHHRRITGRESPSGSTGDEGCWYNVTFRRFE